ncbi:carotenoid biosynthesis protein [Algoriphagus sediminis]|uniref:Carotenoid biosynthesis protein n=1 Tax=Algoriphagus sediminis TaxID=3057113 RepID=A0ABT7YBI4_9BACT|nr:carotenoid biosynthesis protein [Algoriphagus sediminis]MDN3203890.1 carotenoid biosynthesis protein [Algoriphagus sediminis]
MSSPQTISKERKVNIRFLVARILVIAIYAAGAIGLSFPEYKELFEFLTPFQLIGTTCLLLLFHKGWNDSFPIFGAAAFWIGFGSEIIGIHTGLLFGNYVYGPTLGPKLWEVPLVIGLNWFLLVYLSGALFSKSVKNDYLGAALGAAVMTALDYVIEPVAVVMDMWYWKFDIIPPSNYAGWFLIAFIIHLIYRKANFAKENPLVPYLLVSMILFFTILNFTIV